MPPRLRRHAAYASRAGLAAAAVLLLGSCLRSSAPRDDHTALAVAVSYHYACALAGAGQLSCWGANNWGQVRPDARTLVEPTPRAYPGLDDVIDVALAEDHACVVRRDGTVWCWGANDSGQVGDGTTTLRLAPAAVPGLADIRALSLGPRVSCARDGDGRWWCWGTAGTTSFGYHVRSLVPSVGADGAVTTPLEATRIAGATRLSMGTLVGAALDADGHVLTWGYYQDASGYGWTDPARVSGIDDVLDVRAGGLVACALRRNGTAACWYSFERTALPVEVPGLEGAKAISSLGDAFCAVRADATLACWSATPMAGTPLQLSPAVAVPGIAEVRTFDGAEAFGCALTADGAVRCRGSNTDGQLGNGRSLFTPVPTEVPGLDGVTALSTAGASNACALRDDGTVWCWGGMPSGETPATTSVDRSEPAPVSGVADAQELSANCARLGDGRVVCWDRSRWGRDVNGGTQSPAPLTLIGGLPPDVRGIACGGGDGDGAACGCARTGDGRLFCWSDGSQPAAEVLGISDVVDIAGSASTGCARTGGGRVYCWVAPPGQPCVPPAPEPFAGFAGATALWVDEYYLCARDVYRRWNCSFTGVTDTLPYWAPPAGFEASEGFVVDLASACGFDAAGAVRCAGEGAWAALGTNDATASSATALGDGVTGLIELDLFDRCALRAGRVLCWGKNDAGQLGLGDWNYDHPFAEVLR